MRVDKVALRATAANGVLMWSRWDPDSQMPLNSFVVRGNPNVIVNPLNLDDSDVERLRQFGPCVIVVTDEHSERDALVLAQVLDTQIYSAVHFEGNPRWSEITQELVIGRVAVAPLEGFKTPGNCALRVNDCATLIVGHALLGSPAGTLRVAEDEASADRAGQCATLRRLWSWEPVNALVSEGSCVFGSAARGVAEALQSLDDAPINRINVEDLRWIERIGPGRIRRRQAEVGLLIGARKLGYQLLEVDPGNLATPMHCHSEEEELYFIIQGHGTVRSSNGEFEVRKGDFIAFEIGRSGTHQIKNTGDEPLIVLAVSNTATGDCCEYPDSDKLLVARGIMQRLVSGNRGVDLGYWDGETG